MQLPEHEIIDDYLSGESIDPCEYDAYSLEKLSQFLGDEEEY